MTVAAHHTSVRPSPQGTGRRSRAVCDCGWTGEPRDGTEKAGDDALEHVREMCTLEPKLTRHDVAVLRAVPPFYDDGPSDVAVSAWQIAEALNTTNMDDVLMTLGGFEQLDYVRGVVSRRRKRYVYLRTKKGDEAAEA